MSAAAVTVLVASAGASAGILIVVGVSGPIAGIIGVCPRLGVSRASGRKHVARVVAVVVGGRVVAGVGHHVVKIGLMGRHSIVGSVAGRRVVGGHVRVVRVGAPEGLAGDGRHGGEVTGRGRFWSGCWDRDWSRRVAADFVKDLDDSAVGLGIGV